MDGFIVLKLVPEGKGGPATQVVLPRTEEGCSAASTSVTELVQFVARLNRLQHGHGVELLLRLPAQGTTAITPTTLASFLSMSNNPMERNGTMTVSCKLLKPVAQEMLGIC